jgi:gas vesicle protein
VYLNEEVCCMADEPTGGESIGGEAARLLTAALIGGIVGAALGLLLAPKPGTELRSDIKDKAGAAAERAQGIGERAKELVETAKQKIEERRAGGAEEPIEEEAEAGAAEA